MSDEMKLLYAMCEAMDFKVEVDLDYDERKEHKDSAMRYNHGRLGMDRRLKAASGQLGAPMLLDIDEEGMYTSLLVDPIRGYRVAKKTVVINIVKEADDV